MLHVVPLNDERQHDLSGDCWCEPLVEWIDPETGQPWACGTARAIHDAADCREVSEEITDECVDEGRKWELVFD